jgi:hypothetical protein
MRLLRFFLTMIRDLLESVPDTRLTRLVAHYSLPLLVVSSVPDAVRYGAGLAGHYQAVAFLEDWRFDWPFGLMWIVGFGGLFLHMMRLCETCAERAPLDPAGQAERRRWQFRAAHLLMDRPYWYGLLLLTGIVASFVTPASRPGGAVHLTLLTLVIWLTFVGRTHARLQPWCPWCHGGGGGPREYVPPTPVPSAA